MSESDLIALVAALAAVASAAIAWLTLRGAGRKIKISATIFHDDSGNPRIKLVAINSAPREVEIQFSNVLFKPRITLARMFGVKGPEIWETAHINWTGPELPHRLRGDSPTTWWGDAYMVEYNLGGRVGPGFAGKIDINIGGRSKFIVLEFRDWSNTYFPPHDRPPSIESADLVDHVKTIKQSSSLMFHAMSAEQGNMHFRLEWSLADTSGTYSAGTRRGLRRRTDGAAVYAKGSCR